jgi:predicted MPP superfamily phosphohydrolase
MNRWVVVFLIAGSLFTYLGLRFAPAFGWGGWALAFLLIGLVLIYPFTWNRHFKYIKPLRWIAYVDMGFISFVFSLLVVRDLIFLPLTWFKPELEDLVFGPTGAITVLVLAMLALAIGVQRARSGPHVLKVDVPIANLADEFVDFRIAQISDLHVGPTIGKNYVTRVVDLVNKELPDMTVLTGDIGDGNLDEFRDAIQPLRDLKPVNQVYFVPGNHEYYWNGPLWIEEFKSLGQQALLNSRVVITRGRAKLLLAGVLDPAVQMVSPQAKPDVAAALGVPIDGAVKILLSHHPGTARTANALGFDLQLSGHTHGGQFHPWTFFIRYFHEFHRGLTSAGRMWVYVNSGTGTWGPPIRLGTWAEITLLRLIRLSN